MDDTKRKHQRHPLQTDLTSYLALGDDTPVKCIGTDVSVDGLGLVAFVQLEVGAKVVLTLNKKKLPLKVVWSKPDGVRSSIYHAGLVLVGGGDLAAEFQSAGLLKIVQAYSFRTLNRK